MPKSWTTERLIQMLSPLRSGRFNSRQMAERLRVNRRPVFRDLARLNAAGIHPQYDEQREVYTLPKVPVLRGLSSADAITLSIALQFPLPGHREHEAWKTIGSLLAEAGFGWPDAHNEILFRIPADETRHDVFEALLGALLCKQCIRVDTLVYSTKLSPYTIAWDAGRWFVVGRSSFHRKPLAIPMADVRFTVQLEDRYRVPVRFRAERHLKPSQRPRR